MKFLCWLFGHRTSAQAQAIRRIAEKAGLVCSYQTCSRCGKNAVEEKQ